MLNANVRAVVWRKCTVTLLVDGAGWAYGVTWGIGNASGLGFAV